MSISKIKVKITELANAKEKKTVSAIRETYE
jgi:hypothetical protein